MVTLTMEIWGYADIYDEETVKRNPTMNWWEFQELNEINKSFYSDTDAIQWLYDQGFWDIELEENFEWYKDSYDNRVTHNIGAIYQKYGNDGSEKTAQYREYVFYIDEVK